MDGLFLPFEAHRIKSIPLCVTDQEDCIYWPRCRSSSYSVKTGYQLLCENELNSFPSRSSSDVVKNFWKCIWHLKVPNKVKVFLWRACSRALLTKVNLQRRKVVDNSVCDLCGCMVEDEVHALWDCEHVHEGWAHSFAEVRQKCWNIVSMSDLVSIVMAEGNNLEVFVMTTWLIWLWRNKLRTNENPQPCLKITQTASSLLAKFQQGRQRQVTRKIIGPVWWQPPTGNSVKANFDGAVFGEEQETGIGVVICNNERQVLATLLE